MRIVFLTHSIGFGGAEKVMSFVANSLAENGHDIIVINFNSIGEYITQVSQEFNESIKLYSFSGNSSGIRRRYEILRFTYDIVKANRPDVLVGFTTFPNFIGKIVGSIFHIPSIMSERGDPNFTINKKNLHSLLELLVVNQSDGAVFQIKGASEFYAKRLQKRGAIIPNPIFTQVEMENEKIVERQKTVVSVGRLDNYQKRYDVMIEAFYLFSKKHPDYILKLYGDGQDKKQIMQWAQDAGIDSKLKFMGLSKTPMKDIYSDGIFLITSDYEGISNSLLEAMAVGLPCVSTDSTPGGARMLIEDGKNGLLCPVRDPIKIADALCTFADNPKLAEQCGRHARNVLSTFAPSKIAALWENYINQVVYEFNKKTSIENK